jgi:hypothetical protein
MSIDLKRLLSHISWIIENAWGAGVWNGIDIGAVEICDEQLRRDLI